MKLDQMAYYLKDNRVHSAPILSIMTVENLHDDWDSTEAQVNTFTPFGKSGVFYNTCHGIISQEGL